MTGMLIELIIPKIQIYMSRYANLQMKFKKFMYN